jgi:hypothetical protein
MCIFVNVCKWSNLRKEQYHVSNTQKDSIVCHRLSESLFLHYKEQPLTAVYNCHIKSYTHLHNSISLPHGKHELRNIVVLVILWLCLPFTIKCSTIIRGPWHHKPSSNPFLESLQKKSRKITKRSLPTEKDGLPPNTHFKVTLR